MDSQVNQRKDQRIVWLLNHTTLREFEVPLMRRLGLEVYCPKRFPRNPDNRSASVSDEFDSSLTIPQADLERLNAFDFYSDAYPPEIRRILNEHFGTVIVAYMFPMFENVLADFRGRILLRVFGSTHPTYTYYSFAREVATPAFERRIAKVSDRFWFAQAYRNLKWIEPSIFQRRSVDLPLGLADRITEHQGTWTGGDRKILFVCPEIETYDESKQIYQEFKGSFGDLGHVICGAQSKPHTDAAVLGKVDSATYDGFFRTCNVMFYHSRLPRHIHYHPLEAICYGMPVVYMQQGMLGQLTDRKLPGACDTLQEARQKVDRLIEGKDKGFAESIRESQQEIYRLFTKDYADALWQSEFIEKVLKVQIPEPDSTGSIAILPLASTRSLEGHCKRLSDQIAESSRDAKKPRVGSLERWTPATDTGSKACFVWKVISGESLRYVQRLSGHAASASESVSIAPDDGICDFMDCDVWIVVGDRCSAPIAPVKPYLFMYIPADAAVPLSTTQHRSTAISLQNAAAVLVPSQADRDVLVREYGISQDWIVIFENHSTGECLWEILKNIP